MWFYEQATGWLWDKNKKRFSLGYSGAQPFGYNNPLAQTIRCIGPIPVGFYLIGKPRDTAGHGPDAMPLTPDPANQMWGREDFLMHGDKIGHPGTASQGCIIQPHVKRIQVWDSGDHDLQVVVTM